MLCPRAAYAGPRDAEHPGEGPGTGPGGGGDPAAAGDPGGRGAGAGCGNSADDPEPLPRAEGARQHPDDHPQPDGGRLVPGAGHKPGGAGPGMLPGGDPPLRGDGDRDRGIRPRGPVRGGKRAVPVFQHGGGTERKPGPVRPALPEGIHLPGTPGGLAEPPGRMPAGRAAHAAGRGGGLGEAGRAGQAAGVRRGGDRRLPQGAGQPGGGRLPQGGPGGEGRAAADLQPGRVHEGIRLRMRGRGGDLAGAGEPLRSGHRPGGAGGRAVRKGADDAGNARRGRAGIPFPARGGEPHLFRQKRAGGGNRPGAAAGRHAGAGRGRMRPADGRGADAPGGGNARAPGQGRHGPVGGGGRDAYAAGNGRGKRSGSPGRNSGRGQNPAGPGGGAAQEPEPDGGHPV